MPTPIKVGDHSELLKNNPRYELLVTRVNAQALALDQAFDALIAEFPLEENDAVYCVFGDNQVRPTYQSSGD